MNHTKGEWVAMNRTGTGLYKIVSDTLQEVCETQMPYGDDLSRPEVFEQGKANAKLIAASPDLLKALQELIEVKDWKDKNGKDEHYEKSQPVAWKNAKAAIKKALGQQALHLTPANMLSA